VDTSFALILSGFGVGVIVGLTGVGGGSLMTPLLIFGFGIKSVIAVGTDLLFAAFTKLGGSVNLALSRTIDWKIVFQLSLGSIPASLLTIAALKYVGHTSEAFGQVIQITLGFALLLTAIASFYKAHFGQLRTANVAANVNNVASATNATPALETQSVNSQAGKTASDPAQALHPLLPVLFGALVGVLITMTSVGAGAIGVMALMLLYPALPLSRIVAADIAYAVPITLVAGLGHASLGTVDWPLLVHLLAGSLPGIWLGTRLNSRWPDKALRTLLSLVIAYAGIRLLAL
jgi:uncharacterized membrane protein YfcA